MDDMDDMDDAYQVSISYGDQYYRDFYQNVVYPIRAWVKENVIGNYDSFNFDRDYVFKNFADAFAFKLAFPDNTTEIRSTLYRFR